MELFINQCFPTPATSFLLGQRPILLYLQSAELVFPYYEYENMRNMRNLTSIE
jgi:hypothetical protein